MRTVHGTVPPPFNGVGISWSHFFAIFFLPLYQSTWSRLTWVTEIQSHQGFYLPTTSGSCAFDGWSALFHTRQTLFCVKLFDSLFDLSSYHIISSFISYLSVIYLFAFRAPSSNFVRQRTLVRQKQQCIGFAIWVSLQFAAYAAWSSETHQEHQNVEQAWKFYKQKKNTSNKKYQKVITLSVRKRTWMSFPIRF